MEKKHPSAKRAAEQLNSLTWVSGIWFGTCETQQCELIWGKPLNNMMQGTYTVHETGKPISTGRLQMSVEGRYVVFMMKPLELDLLPLGGIVEAAKFQLVELEENRAVFQSQYEEPFTSIEICRTGNSLTSSFQDQKRIEANTDLFNFELTAV